MDLKQFWGAGGNSDADTAHVIVESILFDGDLVHLFDIACVRGRCGQKSVMNRGGITVR